MTLHEGPCNGCQQRDMEIYSLQEKLEEARKDGERLDWLDQSWVSVEKFPNWKWMSNRTDVHPMLKHTLSPDSLRTAIDAAMEGEVDGEE